LVVEPETGLGTATNRVGECETQTDDIQAYAQFVCVAPRIALAIRQALSLIEGPASLEALCPSTSP
jgi:hypothetical protein